jgi:hypothetical protein
MSNRIFKNKRASEKEGLIDRIDADMRIPREHVYCYFDDQKYMDYDQSVDDEYKQNGGFHRYTGNKERIIAYDPPEIREIMDNMDCDHFIWISKAIGDSDDLKFSWYYAHELQHLVHYIENPALCNLTYFLCETYSGIDRQRWRCEVPVEFDCDQKAKMIVKNIFGPERCDEGIRSVFTKEEYLKFREIEASMPFDIEEDTIRIICEHKEQFNQCTCYLDQYDIDIDGICAKYFTRKTLGSKTCCK